MHNDNAMKVPLYVLLVIESTLIAAGVAVHPGCECIVFSKVHGKEKGSFKSPDFPKPYASNIDCLLYTFVGDEDEIVELAFTDFDVHKTADDCISGDYLKVFMHLEGHSVNEYTPWESVLCGGYADIPAVIYSSGSVLVLAFHSGARTANASGFLGTFRFLQKKLFRTDGWKLPSTSCDYEFYSSDHSLLQGKFYSPRFPSSYPTNIRCTYKFQARYKERVRILFEEVALQKGDISCLNRADIVRVFDGSASADPSIRILCNENSGAEILSSGPDLFIEFIANSDRPGRGFKGKYQFQRSDSTAESTSKTRTCDCINCLGKSTLEDIDVLLKRLDIIRKCCPIFEQCNSIKRNPLTHDRSRSRIPLAIHRLKKDTNLCSLSYVEPTKSHSADSIDDASASFYRNKSLERTSIIKQDAQKGAKSGKKVTFSELNTANRPKLHIDLCDLQRAGDEDDVDGHLDEDRRILEDKIHQINNLRREWLLRNSSGVIDGYKDTSRTYRIW